MIIGIVLPSLPGYSETFFRNKILGLQQEGVEVILFVNDSKGQNVFLNCKVITGPKLNGNKIRVVIETIKMLISVVFIFPKKSLHLFSLNKKDKISFFQNCKIIILNQFFLREKLDWLHFGFGTMALGRENIAEIIGARMAVSFRGFDHYVYPIKHANCYRLLFSKNVKYHVLSEGMRRTLENKGIHSGNIKKITPAINLDLFKLKEDQKKDSDFQILTVARLHWIKGLDYTLQALSILKNKGFKFHYTIVGEGLERERLLFQVHQLDLVNCVTFTGELSSEEVKNKLEEADLYIQYSNQEGFCNAVLEAQAMGKLCVVSDGEGLTENVVNNVTGFVVEKRNPKLLNEKIIQVITMPSSMKEIIRKNAIERIKSQFCLKEQKEKFISFYTVD